MPNAAAAAAVADLGNGWPAWPQEGKIVDQNELQQVQAQADELVQQAMLQLPNASQSTETVSSEVMAFFRAQGPPIRLELPLIQDRQAIVPYFNNNMDKDSDYPIFQLAKTLGLHQVFGPMPSAQMLVQDILQAATVHHLDLYIQRPLQIGLAQFPTMQHYYLHHLGKQPQQRQVRSPCPGYIFSEFKPGKVIVDPFWGNNWKASTSTAAQVPNVLIRMEATRTEILEFQNNDVMEIKHSGSLSQTEIEHSTIFSQADTISAGHDAVDLQLALLQDDIYHQPTQSAGHAAADLQIVMLPDAINHRPIQSVLPTKSKNRKSR
jgi:hypothetical protein